MTTIIEKLVQYIPDATIVVFPAAVAKLVESLSDDVIRSGTGAMSDENFNRLKKNLEYWALVGASGVATFKLWVHTTVVFCKIRSPWSECLLVTCVVLLTALILLLNYGAGKWANPVDTPKWWKWIWGLVPLTAVAADAIVNFMKTDTASMNSAMS